MFYLRNGKIFEVTKSSKKVLTTEKKRLEDLITILKNEKTRDASSKLADKQVAFYKSAKSAIEKQLAKLSYEERKKKIGVLDENVAFRPKLTLDNKINSSKIEFTTVLLEGKQATAMVKSGKFFVIQDTRGKSFTKKAFIRKVNSSNTKVQDFLLVPAGKIGERRNRAEVALSEGKAHYSMSVKDYAKSRLVKSKPTLIWKNGSTYRALCSFETKDGVASLAESFDTKLNLTEVINY